MFLGKCQNIYSKLLSLSNYLKFNRFEFKRKLCKNVRKPLIRYFSVPIICKVLNSRCNLILFRVLNFIWYSTSWYLYLVLNKTTNYTGIWIKVYFEPLQTPMIIQGFDWTTSNVHRPSIRALTLSETKIGLALNGELVLIWKTK